jgi:hypothetical protein
MSFSSHTYGSIADDASQNLLTTTNAQALKPWSEDFDELTGDISRAIAQLTNPEIPTWLRFSLFFSNTPVFTDARIAIEMMTVNQWPYYADPVFLENLLVKLNVNVNFFKSMIDTRKVLIKVLQNKVNTFYPIGEITDDQCVALKSFQTPAWYEALKNDLNDYLAALNIPRCDPDQLTPMAYNVELERRTWPFELNEESLDNFINRLRNLSHILKSHQFSNELEIYDNLHAKHIKTRNNVVRWLSYVELQLRSIFQVAIEDNACTLNFRS